MADDTHSRIFFFATVQDSCSWPYDKTYDIRSFVGHGNRTTLGWKCHTLAAPSCDIINLGFVIYPCPTHYLASSVKCRHAGRFPSTKIHRLSIIVTDTLQRRASTAEKKHFSSCGHECRSSHPSYRQTFHNIVKTIHREKYLVQRTFSSTVITWTHTLTRTLDRFLDLCNWSGRYISSNLYVLHLTFINCS